MISSIAITGASSGIGRALALQYSRPGVCLAVSGRNVQRLDAVVEECRARGAKVSSAILDVRDAAATASWITETDMERPLDVVIASAGISAGISESTHSFGPLREMIEVNLLGVINTIEPAIERMRQRGSGRIVLIGSIGGLYGIAGAHGYSASKAALKVLAEGLRPQLAIEGIAISLVLPGFVRTPMNEGKGFPTPMRVEPAYAARAICQGVERDRFIIAFPLPVLWGTRLLATLPWLADRIAMRLLGRNR